jgi:hypothetical protein
MAIKILNLLNLNWPQVFLSSKKNAIDHIIPLTNSAIKFKNCRQNNISSFIITMSSDWNSIINLGQHISNFQFNKIETMKCKMLFFQQLNCFLVFKSLMVDHVILGLPK